VESGLKKRTGEWGNAIGFAIFWPGGRNGVVNWQLSNNFSKEWLQSKEKPREECGRCEGALLGDAVWGKRGYLARVGAQKRGMIIFVEKGRRVGVMKTLPRDRW